MSGRHLWDDLGMQPLRLAAHPRGMRARLLVAAGLCVVALSGCSNSASPSASESGPLSNPAKQSMTPAVRGPGHHRLHDSVALNASPPCSLAHLTVFTNSGGGAKGTWVLPILLRNDGPLCRLIPHEVALIVASGHPPIRLSTVDRGGRTPVLARHGAVPLSAALNEICTFAHNAPAHARPLILAVGDQRTRLVNGPLVEPIPACAIGNLRVHVPFRNPITRAPRSAYHELLKTPPSRVR